MEVQLRCLDSELAGHVWTLNFDGHIATLCDSEGTGIAEFAPGEILAAAFQMPSLSRSITNFGLVGKSRVWPFDVSKDDLKRLKAILETAFERSRWRGGRYAWDTSDARDNASAKCEVRTVVSVLKT